MERALRLAFEQQEFCNFYQPIISIETGRVAGFEALVRWQHPQQGLQDAAQFIHEADKSGLSASISWRVLLEACYQMRAWRTYFRREPFFISINISDKQLTQPDLVETLMNILKEADLEAKHLKLEINERFFVEDPSAAMDLFARLKRVGVQLVIDDFGASQHSFTSLHRLPADVLKIDPSFVRSIHESERHAEIVKNIRALSRSLGLLIVAEGVEHIQQFEQIRKIRCDYAQGFYFSRPLETEKVISLLLQDPVW